MIINNHFSPYKESLKGLEKEMTVCKDCPFLVIAGGFKCSRHYDVRGVFDENYGVLPVASNCKLVYVNWRIE